MSLSRKFVPIPKHAFDIGAQRKMAQAINAMRNSRIMQGDSTGIVHHSDGNMVIELPAQPLVKIHPFQIYNIKNASATAAQRKIYTDAGLDIDSLTFQVRGGIIGFRNFYGNGTDYPDLVQGNYESNLYVYGTDSPSPEGLDGNPNGAGDMDYPAKPNTDNSIIIDPVNDTLISSVDNYDTQIVLNTQPDVGDGSRWASIWVNSVNLAEGTFPEMWARMLIPGSGFNNAFPTDENVIPIGIFGVDVKFVANSSNFLIKPFANQYLNDNMVGRYTPNCSTYRGLWSVLNAQIVGGNGLQMYQGDIVVDDTVNFTRNITGGGGGSFQYQKTYVYTNGIGIETVGPNANPSHWQVIGTTVI